MKRIKRVSSGTDSVFYFMCPGCKRWHAFNETIHDFNRDYEYPSLYPRYLLEYQAHMDRPYSKCLLTLFEGVAKFEPDCTHELAGMEVELPPIGDKLDT